MINRHVAIDCPICKAWMDTNLKQNNIHEDVSDIFCTVCGNMIGRIWDEVVEE